MTELLMIDRTQILLCSADVLSENTGMYGSVVVGSQTPWQSVLLLVYPDTDDPFVKVAGVRRFAIFKHYINAVLGYFRKVRTYPPIARIVLNTRIYKSGTCTSQSLMKFFTVHNHCFCLLIVYCCHYNIQCDLSQR